jgi:hypothetical protein
LRRVGGRDCKAEITFTFKKIVIYFFMGVFHSEDFIELHSDLPWRDMRDMRNIAVHEYFGVDKMIVWETLRNNLPPLLPQLKHLIKAANS